MTGETRLGLIVKPLHATNITYEIIHIDMNLRRRCVRPSRLPHVCPSRNQSTGGLGYRVDQGDHGNAVHQMMVDYQKKPKGGLAYLRLLEFAPDGKTVQVRSYSPHRNKMRVSDLEEFKFELRGSPRENTD